MPESDPYMSFSALKWAWDYEAITPSQKLALLALANFSSEGGKSYPSVETICLKTCQEERSVRRALDDLVTAGIIEETKQRAGVTKQLKVYQLPESACERPPKTGVFNSERLPKDPPKRGSSLPSPLPVPTPPPERPVPEPPVPPYKGEEFGFVKSEHNPAEKIGNPHCESPLFEKFWKAYPRKEGKGVARKAFVKAIKKTTIEAMVSAIQTQTKSATWNKDAGIFIPHPSSWLNGERWLDELPAVPQRIYVA